MDYKGLFWGLLAFAFCGLVVFVMFLGLGNNTPAGTYAGGGAFTNEDGGIATTSAYALTSTSKQLSATTSNRYHVLVTAYSGDVWIRCQEDKPAVRGTGIYLTATSSLEIMNSDNICTDGIQAVADGTDGDATAEISYYELRY